MKKQTKVLVAAAMLTLGASFSSLAAIKDATWTQTEDGWMAYDNKNEEQIAENWVLSGGKEYWIGDDEYIEENVWVEGTDNNEGHWLYAREGGLKTINRWQEVYAYDDEDEEADGPSWYYFDAKGRMLKNTKLAYNDNTYFFGADGKMLTGWIEKTTVDGKTVYQAAEEDSAPKNVYYTNEDGALQKSLWLNVFPYGTDADEKDWYVGEDEVYYWLNTSGQPQTGKKDIDGLTYFFGNDAKMLSGWVGTEGNGYFELEADGIEKAVSEVTTVYHTNSIGYADKNEWEKIEAPNTDDEYWYWFDKNGKVYKPEATEAIGLVTFKNGELDAELGEAFTATESNAAEKKIDGVKYLFNNEGQMQTGLLYKGTDSNAIYYYGTEDQGAMQTGSKLIEDAEGYTFWFYFGKDDN